MECKNLFATNSDLNNKSSIVKLEKGGVVNIRIKSKAFNGTSVANLLKKLSFVVLRYKKGCKWINLFFDIFHPDDKLVYIILECIIYSLAVEYEYIVHIYMKKPEEEIYTNALWESPIISQLAGKREQNISGFAKKFAFDIHDRHFRRILSSKDMNGERVALLMGDIKSFLKPFDIEKEYRDKIAEVVTELIDNCGEHTEADCLVDIDVSDTLKHKQDEQHIYYVVNIVVLNFSDKLLGADITQKIKQKFFDKSKRYHDVSDAYDYHKKFFDKGYTEEDFFNITVFQDRISGRKNEENSGGTGLTELIYLLEKNAKFHHCYILSGDKGIAFEPDFLEYNSEEWLGFNKSKDYLGNIPDKDVLIRSDTFFPGTAYNFTFVRKKGEEYDAGN